MNPYKTCVSILIEGNIKGFNQKTKDLCGFTLFFQDLFQRNKLVDIVPHRLSPTWKNRRSRAKGVRKRLDKFLMFKSLIGSYARYRSWKSVSNI